VADYIGKYIGFGIDTFIIESDNNELEHIAKVFEIVGLQNKSYCLTS
jgi:hypothetical protein